MYYSSLRIISQENKNDANLTREEVKERVSSKGVVVSERTEFIGIPRFFYTKISTRKEPYSEESFLNEFSSCITFGGETYVDSSHDTPFPSSACKFTSVQRLDFEPGKIIVGKNCQLQGTCIVSYSSVTIGDDVLFGCNVSIMDCDGHAVDRFESAEDELETLSVMPVKIENNVWIGNDVTILKGVTIGTGAVIGANSVVTKNVEPNCIYAGNPAKFIRHIKSKRPMNP